MMTRAQACNVLNVEAEASAEAVKHAYRRAALRWHPDRCDEPDAARRFTEVHAAYEWLMATPDATPGARDERRATPSPSSASRTRPTRRKLRATSRTHFRRRVRGHTVTMKRVTVERHATGRRREVYRIRFELGNEPLAYFMWLQEARDEGLRIIDV